MKVRAAHAAQRSKRSAPDYRRALPAYSAALRARLGRSRVTSPGWSLLVLLLAVLEQLPAVLPVAAPEAGHLVVLPPLILGQDVAQLGLEVGPQVGDPLLLVRVQSQPLLHLGAQQVRAVVGDGVPVAAAAFTGAGPLQL